MNLGDGPALLWGFSAALGGGLLIGLERERRKGRGPQRRPAGVRSFTLVCGAGALAQSLGQPLLVAAGALGIIALAALAYWKSHSADPGLTTELALVATYLIGVLCLEAPALGAGAAVVLTGLLTLRGTLHRFSTRLVTEAELHDGLLLAGLALVLLPLLPAAPQPWLGGVAPRALVGLVVLMLAVQAAGHVAMRLLGARLGLALAGLLGGLVSSTATVASMGARARAHPAEQAVCAGAATLSAVATWGLALVLLATLAPALALHLAPAALAGATVALVAGAAQSRHAGAASPTPRAAGGPLQVREAALVALLLTAVAAVAGWARGAFGETGLLVTVVLAAVADTHSGIAAVGALVHGGTLAPAPAATAVLAAIATNSLTRCAVAWASGGRAYGTRVAAGLLGSLAAALGVTALQM